MKTLIKTFGIALLLSIPTLSLAQFIIQQGATFHGAGLITLKDIQLNNLEPSADFKDATLMFTGKSDSRIQGVDNWTVGSIIINKNNGRLLLDNALQVRDSISMVAGHIDLNGHNIMLFPGAILLNEKENASITGPSGGELMISLPLNIPNGVNPGNLGLHITSSSELGSATIKRGHLKQTSSIFGSSLARYYDVVLQPGLTGSAEIRFYYLDAELDTLQETMTDLFHSIDHGSTWSWDASTSRDGSANFVESSIQLGSGKWTLFSSAVALPVTGMVLDGKRISNTMVELSWQTLQESHNKGFGIERRKDNETLFSQTGFVNSLAPNGSSATTLNYTFKDNNDHKGKTYYRLRQEDLDGHTTYSNTVVVQGAKKGKTRLTLWPVPTTGTLNIRTEGLEQEDELLIYDLQGRMIKTIRVTDAATVQVTGLRAGTYFVTLASNRELVEKFIVL